MCISSSSVLSITGLYLMLTFPDSSIQANVCLRQCCSIGFFVWPSSGFA